MLVLCDGALPACVGMATACASRLEICGAHTGQPFLIDFMSAQPFAYDIWESRHDEEDRAFHLQVKTSVLEVDVSLQISEGGEAGDKFLGFAPLSGAELEPEVVRGECCADRCLSF